MKRFSSLLFSIAATLCAMLTTFIGCSGAASDKPAEIKRRGQDSGYQGTTVPPRTAGDTTTSHDH